MERILFQLEVCRKMRVEGKRVRREIRIMMNSSLYLDVLKINGLFGSLERGVERRRVVGRRVEGNGSPLPCLDVFKISKGEGSN